MADASITISNSMRCFGAGPSTKWGASWGAGSQYTMTWGSAKWGEGSEDIHHEMTKLISNSEALTSAETFNVEKALAVTLSVTEDMAEETLQDSAGYYYNFPKPSRDAEDRSLTSWTEGADGSTNWTEVNPNDQTWTEV